MSLKTLLQEPGKKRSSHGRTSPVREKLPQQLRMRRVDHFPGKKIYRCSTHLSTQRAKKFNMESSRYVTELQIDGRPTSIISVPRLLAASLNPVYPFSAIPCPALKSLHIMADAKGWNNYFHRCSLSLAMVTTHPFASCLVLTPVLVSENLALPAKKMIIRVHFIRCSALGRLGARHKPQGLASEFIWMSSDQDCSSRFSYVLGPTWWWPIPVPTLSSPIHMWFIRSFSFLKPAPACGFVDLRHHQ